MVIARQTLQNPQTAPPCRHPRPADCNSAVIDKLSNTRLRRAPQVATVVNLPGDIIGRPCTGLKIRLVLYRICAEIYLKTVYLCGCVNTEPSILWDLKVPKLGRGLYVVLMPGRHVDSITKVGPEPLRSRWQKLFVMTGTCPDLTNARQGADFIQFKMLPSEAPGRDRLFFVVSMRCNATEDVNKQYACPVGEALF